MNYKNYRAFANKFPLRKMSGKQKFLLVASFLVKGHANKTVATKEISVKWLKGLLGIKYSNIHFLRAQEEGWVNPIGAGNLQVTSDGIDHLKSLETSVAFTEKISDSTKINLKIFHKKDAYSFDKFLRGIVAGSKKSVFVVDSFVDHNTFDNVLDTIPKTVSLKLLYKRGQGNFQARVVRFSKSYPKFQHKKKNYIHDRFIIVDDMGYIIGTSIKNAADRSPTLVVILDKKNSILLKQFFNSIWK